MTSSGLAAVSRASPFRVFAPSFPVVMMTGVGIFVCACLYLRHRHIVHLKALEREQQAIRGFESLKNKILSGTPLTDQDRKSPTFEVLNHVLKQDPWMTPERLDVTRFSLVVLHVLFGIKPACEFAFDPFCQQLSCEYFVPAIKKACTLNPSCHLEQNTKGNKHCYILVNKSPIPLFDPAKYLKNYEDWKDSLSILRKYELGDRVWQQQMSYVAGYGPSWEAFYEYAAVPDTAPDGRPVEQATAPDTTEDDVFSDAHYQQLGVATDPNSLQDAVQRGRMYSQTEREWVKKCDLSRQLQN